MIRILMYQVIKFYGILVRFLLGDICRKINFFSNEKQLVIYEYWLKFHKSISLSLVDL